MLLLRMMPPINRCIKSNFLSFKVLFQGGDTIGKHHLEEHIRYVSRRYIPEQDERKRNVGRYLEVAADGYLKRFKH